MSCKHPLVKMMPSADYPNTLFCRECEKRYEFDKHLNVYAEWLPESKKCEEKWECAHQYFTDKEGRVTHCSCHKEENEGCPSQWICVQGKKKGAIETFLNPEIREDGRVYDDYTGPDRMKQNVWEPYRDCVCDVQADCGRCNIEAAKAHDDGFRADLFDYLETKVERLQRGESFEIGQLRKKYL